MNTDEFQLYVSICPDCRYPTAETQASYMFSFSPTTTLKSRYFFHKWLTFIAHTSGVSWESTDLGWAQHNVSLIFLEPTTNPSIEGIEHAGTHKVLKHRLRTSTLLLLPHSIKVSLMATPRVQVVEHCKIRWKREWYLGTDQGPQHAKRHTGIATEWHVPH